jgi:hypothetical protein
MFFFSTVVTHVLGSSYKKIKNKRRRKEKIQKIKNKKIIRKKTKKYILECLQNSQRLVDEDQIYKD